VPFTGTLCPSWGVAALRGSGYPPGYCVAGGHPARDFNPSVDPSLGTARTPARRPLRGHPARHPAPGSGAGLRYWCGQGMAGTLTPASPPSPHPRRGASAVVRFWVVPPVGGIARVVAPPPSNRALSHSSSARPVRLRALWLRSLPSSPAVPLRLLFRPCPRPFLSVSLRRPSSPRLAHLAASSCPNQTAKRSSAAAPSVAHQSRSSGTRGGDVAGSGAVASAGQ